MSAKMKTTPFGKMLRRMRVDLDETQAAMAIRIGVTNGELCQIEHGRAIPSHVVVERVIAVYKMSKRDADQMRIVAQSGHGFVLRPMTVDQVMTAHLLSERFASLDPAQCGEIRSIVEDGPMASDSGIRVA